MIHGCGSVIMANPHVGVVQSTSGCSQPHKWVWSSLHVGVVQVMGGCGPDYLCIFCLAQ